MYYCGECNNSFSCYEAFQVHRKNVKCLEVNEFYDVGLVNRNKTFQDISSSRKRLFNYWTFKDKIVSLQPIRSPRNFKKKFIPLVKRS